MTELPFPWASLKRLHDHFAGVAIAHVDAGDAVAPQLFLLELSPDGQPLQICVTPTEVIQGFMDSPGSKDELSLFLRDMLTPGARQQAFEADVGFRPNALVQISEAWMAEAPDGKLPEDSAGLSISERADRQEVLMVLLHLAGRTIPMFHPILSAPKRHVAPRQFPRGEVYEGGGRFSMGGHPAEGQYH